MKMKICLLVAGLGAIALFIFLQPRPRGESINEPSSSAPEESAEASVTKRPSKLEPKAAPLQSEHPEPPGGSEETAEAKHSAYVMERVAELEDLGMESDTASLDTILSELTNRDPEIRQAALEAAVQFGSRDAIPRMADAASQTDDAHEKNQINEAIEFLKLPSLTETLGQSATTPAKQRPPEAKLENAARAKPNPF